MFNWCVSNVLRIEESMRPRDSWYSSAKMHRLRRKTGFRLKFYSRSHEGSFDKIELHIGASACRDISMRRELSSYGVSRKIFISSESKFIYGKKKLQCVIRIYENNLRAITLTIGYWLIGTFLYEYARIKYFDKIFIWSFIIMYLIPDVRKSQKQHPIKLPSVKIV